MTRGLSVAQQAAAAAEQVARTVAVELDFPDGFARFHGGHDSITIDGNTFSGVGQLGSVSVAEESAELRAYGLVVRLSGVPRDAVAYALGQAYQGRKGTVWEVQLDPATFQVIGTPLVVFRGRMDQLDIALGAQASVTCRLENRLADWDRPRIQRFTDDEQRRRDPADGSFRFLPATTEKEIIWPARSFTG
jgi:hypothetical protein